MLQLQINKKTISIPSVLSEIPLYKGIEVMQFAYGKKDISYIDKLAIISTLSGLDPSIFMHVKKEIIDNIFNNLNFLKDEDHSVKYFESFKLNNKIYGLVDFDSLTVIEYADIDFYLTQGEYQLENLHKILAVVLRRVTYKKQTFKNILKNIISGIFYKNVIPKAYKSYKIKDYEESDINNADLFNEKIDMGFAMGIYKQIVDYKLNLINEFSPIFSNTTTDDKDEDQYDDPEITKKMPKSFEQIWGIYHCVNILSSSLMERDLWYTRSIKEFFKYLSYHNMLTSIENEKMRLMNQ